MNVYNMTFLKFALTIYTLMLFVPALGQEKILTGMVADSISGDPIPAASIKLIGAISGGTLGNPDGSYTVKYNPRIHSLQFSAIGYRSKTIYIDSLYATKGLVLLGQEVSSLREIVITAGHKPRYKNKNNPAVEFIRHIIDHLQDNNARKEREFAYIEYEKLSMSLSFENDKLSSSKFLNKYPFLLKGLDSVKRKRRSLVPVYIQEKSSRFNYRNYQLSDSVLLGTNQSRIDQYLDEDGFDEFLDKLYGRPDLYAHDVALGNRRFLSPVSALAPAFYKYYIADTIKTTQPWQLKLDIYPRNKQDALLSGTLYVSLDGKYAIQRAELYVNNQANLNWVDDLHVNLTYEKNDLGKYFLSKSEMSLHLGLFKKGMGIFGEKTFVISGFVNATTGAAYDTMVNRSLRQTDWANIRPEPLKKMEQTAFANVDSLKHSGPFRRSMALGAFFLSGYIDKGAVEIGPINSFYSFNPIEGSRLRFGGRTTDAFSKRLFFDAYGAYGFRDKRLKYGLTTTVSLTKGSIYKFPVRSLSLSHSYDLQIPGQELKFLTDDNILLSFKRGANNKMWYNKKWQLEYLHETPAHLSFRLGLTTQQIEPAGVLTLQKNTITGQKDTYLKTTEAFVELRWAPNETFFQGKRYRRPINNGYPVFTLRYTKGINGLLEGTYNYHRMMASVTKRFYFSQLGHTDAMLEGGAVLGAVPYPLLAIHRANQTYTYQLTSYNLMNFMEFMSDKYAAINLQHSFNGFFLNKVPMIKKLGLREVVSFKVLSGTISRQNNPKYNQGLYLLPIGEAARPMSHSLERGPYMEASAGISNIFKILRVDWIQRLSYLDHPGISNWGIRAKLHVDF